jgi:hypothetical protein
VYNKWVGCVARVAQRPRREQHRCDFYLQVNANSSACPIIQNGNRIAFLLSRSKGSRRVADDRLRIVISLVIRRRTAPPSLRAAPSAAGWDH